LGSVPQLQSPHVARTRSTVELSRFW
jgi:hypothetical protein